MQIKTIAIGSDYYDGPEVPEFRAIMRKQLEKVNEYLIRKQYSPLPDLSQFDKERMEKGSEWTGFEYAHVRWTKTNNNDYSAMIDYAWSTRQFYKLFTPARHDAYLLAHVQREEGPKLTEREVRVKAQEFVNLFASDTLGGFKFDFARWEFGCSFWANEKAVLRAGEKNTGGTLYKEGYWVIMFGRYTKSGIPFNDDYMTMDWYELFGPAFIGVYGATEYEDKPFKDIGEASAKTIANEKVIKLFGPILRLKPDKLVPQNLGIHIVCPNYLMVLNKPENICPNQGRPAYIFRYTNGEKRCSIYIDAETGEHLGSFF